jgi:Flp pilus assembly secretin CpaC
MPAIRPLPFPVPSSINGTFAMSGAGTAAYLLLSACIVPEYRMSFQLLRTRLCAVVVARSLAAGMMLLPVGGLAAPADELIAVNVDQAKLVKFPDRISTIIVGNPLIADVTLQPGGIVVVTGKGYGATNVIAMDRAGTVLMDRVIRVEGPTDKVVTIYRGVSRESYSCSPNCERRVTLGDSESYFKSAMEQAGALSGQASAAGATNVGAGKIN